MGSRLERPTAQPQRPPGPPREISGALRKPPTAATSQHLQIVPQSQGPDRGGAVVCHGNGQVDATIATQLRRIAEAILPGEVIAVEAADIPDVQEEA